MASITRTSAAQVLDSKLKRLAAEVNQAVSDDSPDGYGPDLDDAIRRMALVDITGLNTTAEVSAYLVIARYYALVRFVTLLATRVDTQSFSVEGDRQTIFQNVLVLIKQAVDEAATYGYVLQTHDDGQFGSANKPVDQEQQASSWERTYFDTDFIGAIPDDQSLYVWGFI